MKNHLILIFSLFTVFGYAQTKIDPTLSPTAARINEAIQGSITASGTDTYTGTLTGLTNVTGKAYNVTFGNANTGSATFNLNASGAVTIRKFEGGTLVNLVAGDISAGETKRLRYNGTYLVIEGGAGGGGISELEVGTTDITSGTDTRVLYNNAGTLGEYAISGTGSVAMTSYADGKVADAINDGTTTVAPSQNAVFDALALKANLSPTINTQTTDYTLVLSDAGKIVVVNSATAKNVTVPLNSSVAYPTGTQITIVQKDLGRVSVVATGGVTINTSGGSLSSPGLTGLNSVMVLTKEGTNTWYLWNGSDGGDYTKMPLGGSASLSSALTVNGTGYPLKFNYNGLSTVRTNGYGLWLANTTSATAGSQEYGPSLTFEGNGWKTNSTAESQSVKVYSQLKTVQGAANPGYNFTWGHNINAGSDVEVMQLRLSESVSSLNLAGNLTLTTVGNKLSIKEGSGGSSGQTALTSGVATITISGTTTSTRAHVSFVAIGGTVSSTWQYKAVCTANTLTITAIDNTGATNTSDTSTLNYFLIEPAP